MISGGWIDAFAAREGRKSAWREGARTAAKGSGGELEWLVPSLVDPNVSGSTRSGGKPPPRNHGVPSLNESCSLRLGIDTIRLHRADDDSRTAFL